MKKRFLLVLVRRITVIAVVLALVFCAFPATVFFVGADADTALIVNGDFENGTTGFTNANTATFEVIAEPNNTANHVLHVGGGGRYSQTVTVKKNTNYVWTIRMMKLDDEGAVYFDVLAEDGTTNLITGVSNSGATTYSNMWMNRAAVDVNKNNWGVFTFKFNSGSNTSVTLLGDTWTTNRDMYTDEWTLEETRLKGAVINGDFEDGTNGFTNLDTATFEVKAEPDNTSNHILHVIGGGSYYQSVPVNKNTDYIWTFRMKDLGNTGTTRILVYPESGWDNLINSISHTGDGYSSLNDGTYSSAATYNKNWVTFTVKFNSGENEYIKLWHNTWTTNREIYMDDWKLSKDSKGLLVNGDFEDGLTGYEKDEYLDGFSVITDPTDSANHVLEVGGVKNGTYWQEVSVDPDSDYVWSFRAKRIYGTSGATVVAVYPSGSSTNIATAISHVGNGYSNMWNGSPYIESYNGNWVTYSVEFNSGENTRVRLAHVAGTGAVSRKDYMDDWSLTKKLAPGELANGDFEDGTNGYTNESAAIFEVIEDPQNDENHILHAGGGGKLSQTVAVKKDTNYIWTFEMKNLDSAGNIYADVIASDGVTNLTAAVSHIAGSYAQMFNGRAAINALNGWGTFSIRFYSGENTSVKLQLDTWTGNRDRYFDNWKLKEAAPVGEFLNGDFETGEIAPYQTDRYTTGEITDEDVHSGEYAAIITKDETLGSGYFYQSISIEKNTDYVWTFWLKFNSTNTPVGATVNKTGGIALASRIDGDCDSVVEPSFDWHRIRYEDFEWHEYQIYFSSGDNETVDLMITAYASDSVIVTDDWSLEKIGDTEISDVYIDVDFEDENMGCHEITKPCWTVTDEEAHGGTYSIKYDGSGSSGPTDLLYLNEHGIIADTVSLEKNTKYRFSFWYKGKGERLDMANVTFKLYSGGATYNFTGIYTNEDTEWKYAEHIFDSGDKTGYRLLLQGMILGSRKFSVYIDDIKLEKITVGVTDTTVAPDSVTCTEEENLAPSSAIVAMNDSYSSVQKLELTPYGIYNFAVSYTATAADAQIGIATDENGTPLTEDISIFSIADTADRTERKAYTFCAPEDGIVYLVTKNTAGAAEITDLTLYSLLPVPETPVDQVVLKNPTKTDKTSVWDQDFEFDFDWNTNQGDFDFSADDTNNTEIVEPGENTEVEVSNGKKFLRVKKRSLISKGEPGIETWVIVLICVGAVAAAAGATLLIFLLVHRKKKKGQLIHNG